MLFFNTVLLGAVQAQTVLQAYDEGDYKEFVRSHLDDKMFFVIEEKPEGLKVDDIIYGEKETSDVTSTGAEKIKFETLTTNVLTAVKALATYREAVAEAAELNTKEGKGKALVDEIEALKTVPSFVLDVVKNLLEKKKGAEFGKGFNELTPKDLQNAAVSMETIKTLTGNKDSFVFAMKLEIDSKKKKTDLFEATLKEGKWTLVKKGGAPEASFFSSWWFIGLCIGVFIAILAVGGWYYYNKQKNRHLQEENFQEEEIKP